MDPMRHVTCHPERLVGWCGCPASWLCGCLPCWLAGLLASLLRSEIRPSPSDRTGLARPASGLANQNSKPAVYVYNGPPQKPLETLCFAKTSAICPTPGIRIGFPGQRPS